MLYSLGPSGDIKEITSIPHQDDYATWRNRLDDEEYQVIYDELRSRISGSNIETSSWISPGDDWTGTVFQPIYEKACRCDYDAAAMFFGLIVWHVFMEHDEAWSFGRYSLNNVPIRGLTYFRINLQEST